MLSKLSKLFYYWARGWLILAIFGVLVAYVAVTLPILKASPGGDIDAIDAQFFYTPEKAFSTVALYGHKVLMGLFKAVMNRFKKQ